MAINPSKLSLHSILLTVLILLIGTNAEAATPQSITAPSFSKSFNLGGLSLTTNQSVAVGRGSSATKLIMQSDGNLVVYSNSGAVWASGTKGSNCSSGCTATFQSDGNFVVYASGKPVWASDTHGKSAATLVFQDVTPYLQIANSTGEPIWQSSGPAPATVTQSNSVAPGPWPGDLNILDYGAVADGVTDNTYAIQRALNDAKGNVLKGSKSGIGVFVPAGKFAYSGSTTINKVAFKGGLTVDGVRLDGVGNASELIALDKNNEPIILIGNGPVVANLFLHIDYSGKRLTGHYNEPIFIDQATNFQVDHIYIDNSASGGIGDTQGSFGKVTNNTILNTCADSISNYQGAHDILIDSNYIENSGDDGISVYALYSSSGEQPYNYNINISNNVIINNRWGRNLSVVGGDNITYKNNYANGNNNNLACMYFASEASKDLQTLGAKNVTATGNTLANCGDVTQGYAALTFAAYNGAKDTNDYITVKNTIIEPGENASDNGEGKNHDITVNGPLNYNISLENIEEIGQSLNSLGSGSVVTFTMWDGSQPGDPEGYTPAPAGVSGAIPVVSGDRIPLMLPSNTCGSHPDD